MVTETTDEFHALETMLKSHTSGESRIEVENNLRVKQYTLAAGGKNTLNGVKRER